MYTIGIISEKENKEWDYETEFKAIKCIPSYTTFEAIKEELLIKDAYIIEEQEYDASILELILILRTKFKGILWVVTKEDLETLNKNKNLYFRLGVNGISARHSEKESFFLQLRNSLIYSDKSKIVLEKKENEKLKLELVPRNVSVIKADKEIKLTRLEYRLLELLFSNNGMSISYAEINKFLWNNESYRYYKIANLVFHLRKKIENNPSNPEFIKTIRSVGYLSDLK